MIFLAQMEMKKMLDFHLETFFFTYQLAEIFCNNFKMNLEEVFTIMEIYALQRVKEEWF